MENGDNTDTGLTDSYLAQSYAVMEGKCGSVILHNRTYQKHFLYSSEDKNENCLGRKKTNGAKCSFD